MVIRPNLFDEVDTSLKIHAEINKFPLNAFFLVLFLLQDEHVMIEELLQALVGVVDAQLFKCVELFSHTNKIILCQRYNKLRDRIQQILRERSSET
jgi:hypothetical protein